MAHKLHNKNIIKAHFNKDIMQKWLSALAFELMTTQLMFSGWGIIFLTGICISPIEQFAFIGSQDWG